jgi:hypothetical protein
MKIASISNQGGLFNKLCLDNCYCNPNYLGPNIGLEWGWNTKLWNIGHGLLRYCKKKFCIERISENRVVYYHYKTGKVSGKDCGISKPHQDAGKGESNAKIIQLVVGRSMISRLVKA